jgi:hypothetical protein
MKNIPLFLLAMVSSAMVCGAHGPGHFHRNAEQEVNQALSEQGPSVDTQTTNRAATNERSGKNFKEIVPEAPEKIWDASLTTGWESRHIHYGVNETGNGGAWTTEVEGSIGGLGVSVWNGFGLGNAFEEWDLTIAYTIEAGPVFFIPGYNFRYAPGIVEEGHEHEHSEEEHEEESGHEEEEGSHAHGLYNNELFAILGTNAIPYVTPSVLFLWNLNEAPGGFLAFRLDGEVPVIKDTFTLNPYALLGLNLGYNTTDSYGWNNFEFGVQGNWQINQYLTAFAGANYSVAMTALNDIGQGNEFWVNAGVRVGF